MSVHKDNDLFIFSMHFLMCHLNADLLTSCVIAFTFFSIHQFDAEKVTHSSLHTCHAQHLWKSSPPNLRHQVMDQSETTVDSVHYQRVAFVILFKSSSSSAGIALPAYRRSAVWHFRCHCAHSCPFPARGLSALCMRSYGNDAVSPLKYSRVKCMRQIAFWALQV